MKKIPVILDTDIGDDIDDTWALVMLLRSPELSLKLVTTAFGNTLYRARIVAKLLEIAKRTDVNVGIGIKTDDNEGRQADWIKDYDINNYPGKIFNDGVDALIRTIMDSPEEVTVIAIGPLTNIAEALEREPNIVKKSRLVAMAGNVRKGFGDSKVPIPEYNVKIDVKSAKKVFTSAWDITITPLDTCGFMILEGEKFKKIKECSLPLTKALMENVKMWHEKGGYEPKDFSQSVRSSILFDTVAVYLAFSEEFLVMEDLPIVIEDDGLTAIKEGGKIIRCAVEWKDKSKFEDLLVSRLTSF